MKQRCDNPNNAFYHRYGGRGIGYTKEWNAFIPFYEWAISNGYDDSLTIDRVNNDKGYSPDNCKWSTQKEQAKNKTHIPNKYGYKGIHALFYKGQIYRYKAVCTIDGKEHYIGCAKTPEEAFAIREKYMKENNIYDYPY